MANCKQTPQEFIKSTFTPQIAVLSSSLAEKCCEKNNLTFVELLQPFSRLNNDVYYKDPNGIVITVKNFKMTFLDVNSRPPQTTLARKLLNLAVSDSSAARGQSVSIGNYTLDIPTSSPWFEEWRETFLKVQYPSDHEYTKHFLACLLVISSSDINPLDAILRLCQSLDQMQSISPGKLPKWFSSNILKYYVILHDEAEGVNNIPVETLDVIKSSYGATNCFLLRMNSRPPGFIESNEHFADPWSQFMYSTYNSHMEKSPLINDNILEVAEEANEIKSISFSQSSNYHPLSPDTEELVLNNKINESDDPIRKISMSKVHGSYLATEDVENIKSFIYEFAKSSLLPYIERQIQMLNDNISNKKGVSRSIFSATKRWFNPNKPGASSLSINNLIYAPDAPELQVRRLGDLYFMFGNYSAAFQAYHLAKRDYNTDQAWLYYAGALEMAALSAFMSNESTRKTYDYMEESITTYLNTCKLPQFATRATLLGSECLKSKFSFGEAAHQLIRMTSEESDLRSALLLEQAAYCFLKSSMVRKYAFHMVLSGHRFSKAAQRKHSLRSYKQAYQVFEGNGWSLAGDHIHYTIGRQANNLICYEEAVDSFSKLLSRESRQSPKQQTVFLKEYLTILEKKLHAVPEINLPILPIPQLNKSSIKLLLEPPPPLKTPGRVPAMGINFTDELDPTAEQKWNKLEEMLVQEAQGGLPIVFKPMTTSYNSKKLLTNVPNAIVNEPIQVSLQLVNSLQVVLNLKDVHLLWKFIDGSNEISNENATHNNIDNHIKTHVNELIVLECGSKADVVLLLTPLTIGELIITGICYTVSTGNTPVDSTSIRGKQLVNVCGKPDAEGNTILKDLKIKIVPSAPCLQVTFSELKPDFLCDEMQKVVIDFRNSGSVPLQKIYLATTMPQMVSTCEFRRKTDIVTDFSDIEMLSVKEKIGRKNHTCFVSLPEGQLNSGQSTSISIWLKAPNVKGPYLIDLLIYYECLNTTNTPRYRLVRQSWNLSVQESINVDVTARESFNTKSVEELSISIKTTNLNKTHSSALTEVTLLNIGLLSRYWVFTKEIVAPQIVHLCSQEAAHILLKTRRANKHKSNYSKIPLSSDEILVENINSACMAFAKKTEQRTVNIFDDSEFENFKENKNGVILIQWQAVITDANSRRCVGGQSQIPIEMSKSKDSIEDHYGTSDVTSLLDDYAEQKEREYELQKQQNQVTYNLLFPAIVSHNFVRNKLCMIPITLLVHSVVDEEDLQVTIRTTGTPSKLDPTTLSVCYPHASRHFRWLGSGTILKKVNPLSTETVELSVVVYGPGSFDLGAYVEISCCKLGQPDTFVTQTCQIHSALIVTIDNS